MQSLCANWCNADVEVSSSSSSRCVVCAIERVRSATRCSTLNCLFLLPELKVTEVDANLLRFRNLEELTLTGNYIRRVNSQHLPRTLKVSASIDSLHIIDVYS